MGKSSKVIYCLIRVKIDSDADLESERTVTPVPDDGQRLIPITECLFSGKTFPDVESCLTHMSETYGFFLPELEYIIDLEGLLAYLGELFLVLGISIA